MPHPLLGVSSFLYDHLAHNRKVSPAKDGQRLDFGESTQHDL